MKKNLLLLTALFGLGYLSAQTQHTVSMGAGYANDIYYTLSNDDEATAPRDNWDIAFAASGIGGASSTIRINGAEGTEMYLYGNDISLWNSVDTTGFDWTGNKLEDSDTSWSLGVFENQNLSSAFDLGWGTYSVITHIVTGDRIFILKMMNGDYKKLIINDLTSGVYSFQHANLDGTGAVSSSIDKTDYLDKNFGYYSVQNDLTLDREPISSSWDLAFTQYMAQLSPGVFYPVTGVLSNVHITVAQVNDVPDVSTVSYVGQNFFSDMSTIGHDWKTFNLGTFQFEIADSLAYFVQDASGDIYRIIFTDFGGSATGDFVFTKELITTVGIHENTVNNEILTVYPNPASEAINLTFVGSNETTQLLITDISGKQVFTEQFNANLGLSQKEIDVSDLKRGIYFLTLVSANTQSTTQKIIIQ